MPSLLHWRAEDTRYHGKGGALQEAIQDIRLNSRHLGSSGLALRRSEEAERPGLITPASILGWVPGGLNFIVLLALSGIAASWQRIASAPLF